MFAAVADYLDLVDLLTLTRVCTSLRLHSTAYVDRLYNALLRAHLLDPIPLRHALDKCNGVLAGKSALQFLFRDGYSSSLAFFVPVTKHVEFISEMERQGYERVETTPASPKALRDFHVHTTIEFEKNDSVIKVLVTSTQGPFMALAKLPTTAHLTYIDEKGVHTVVPKMTLERRAIIIRQRWQTPKVRRAMTLPENLTGALGTEILGMRCAGWDVKFGFKWDRAPCGHACGILQQRFKSGLGFHLSFGKTSSTAAVVPYQRATEVADVRFSLRGQCLNPYCENFHETTYGGEFPCQEWN